MGEMNLKTLDRRIQETTGHASELYARFDLAAPDQQWLYERLIDYVETSLFELQKMREQLAAHISTAADPNAPSMPSTGA